MRPLTFTDQAKADLEAIANHIALDNPLRAVTFIQELRDDCLRLRTMRSGIQSWNDTGRRASVGAFTAAI